MSSCWSIKRKCDRLYNKRFIENSPNPQNTVALQNHAQHIGILPEVVQVHQSDTYCSLNDDSSNDDILESHHSVEYHKKYPGQSDHASELSASAAIRQWITNFNVSHSAAKAILGIMRSKYHDLSLPADPRTLMNTPNNTSKFIKSIRGGQYYHFGIKNSLVCFINCFLSSNKISELNANQEILLKLNIDSLPITKSSSHYIKHLKRYVFSIIHAIMLSSFSTFLGNVS